MAAVAADKAAETNPAHCSTIIRLAAAGMSSCEAIAFMNRTALKLAILSSMVLLAIALENTCAHPSLNGCSSSLFALQASTDSAQWAASPRWWDETVQWVRNLGWDRGRLVQLWLFFMLIGLYIILRIKPRA